MRLGLRLSGIAMAMAETNIYLAEARMIAVSALRSGDEAELRAGKAQADQVYQMASTAMLKEQHWVGKTDRVQKSAIGICSPSYKVIGCTQTRYRRLAGGD